MKKLISLLLVLTLVLGLAACGAKEEPKQTQAAVKETVGDTVEEVPATEAGVEFPSMTISFANSYSDTDMVNVTMKQAAANITERTGGKVKVEVFPNNTLGATSDMIEGIVSDAPIVFICGFSAWADYYADVNALACPFVFESAEELFRFFNSETFAEVVAELDKADIHALNSTYIGGLRHVIGQKAYTTPEEIKGLKLRVPADAIFLKTFEKIGAAPIGMPASEQMAALSGGTVDALDQSISLIYSTKSYDLVKHVSLLGQMPLADSAFCSTTWWNSLPAELQEIIAEELYNASYEYYNYAVENEAKMREELEALGVEFHEVDTTPFVEMAGDMILDYGIGQKVLDAVAQIRADIAAGK